MFFKARTLTLAGLVVIVLTLGTSLTRVNRAIASVAPRPPQFIALAFDNCGPLENWDLTRKFSAELADFKISQRFTYFLSGTFYLTANKRGLYQGPKQRPGLSNVGWASSNQEILQRIEQVNLALAEGHEVGSHAGGHFDGSNWAAVDWSREFELFNFLVFGTFQNNTLRPTGALPQVLNLRQSDIVGFRAPYLATSKGLWGTLSKAGFRYDTSLIADPNYWPEKMTGGYWNFPLARLKIVGSGKSTLSMDYNFFFADSKAKEDRTHSKVYEKQMYDTYMKYFMDNYRGNRAPVHIGHHFALWNGGAYWAAMKAFALKVY